MKHLVPFTKDQLSIIETSLWASTKYSDAEYIEPCLFLTYCQHISQLKRILVH